MGTSAASGPQVNKQREKQARLEDDYMMYQYKVIPCSRESTHNWKLCHFWHKGEVAARRRPPSCHQADLCAYVSANKECPDGDKCPYAHNAFESWLHPDRYKTTLCSYAGSCQRRFCFFAHAASELRTPANKQQCAAAPDALRLVKTTSLDTNTSVGTPNSSSSSNISSSSVAQSVHSNWTSSTGSPMRAACGQAASGISYVPHLAQLQQANLMAQQGIAGNLGGMYLFPGSLQQQQLVATMVDASGNASLMPAHPPGLSTIVGTAPQLTTPAATAVHMQLTTGLNSAAGAAGSGMQVWDSAASLAMAANLYRAGSTPMSVTDGSSSFANGYVIDPASPQTPLTVTSMSPAQSPMLNLVAMQVAAGNSLPQLAGSLQQAADNNTRQQLLQHLLNMQQKQQQQQHQQQQQQGALDASSWSLSAVDGSMIGSNISVMLNLNGAALQQTSLATAIGTATNAASWPVMQQQQQQFQQQSPQQQPEAIFTSVPGVQVLSAPQALRHGVQADMPSLPGASVTAADGTTATVIAGSSEATAASYLTTVDATQLQQQLNMLTFAMAQPA